MTTTSATSSASSTILTALGGSGAIDWNSLASNLAEAQFAGQTGRLTNKSETLDKQISDAGGLKSALLALDTSLGDRVRSGDLSPQPALANAAVAKLALSGSATPKGTYTLEVTQLAAAQTLASPPVASATATVGSGTLTLRFGTIAGTGFTENTARAAVPVTIAAGATLSDVAGAINGANGGVFAYVANTAAGPRLVLKGQEGAANGFVLDAAEDAADPGLAALAWEPTGDAARLLATSADAAWKLDGLAMTATSNKITEAIPGLNLTLTATNTGAPTTLSFADNTAAITTVMQDITSALNELVSLVKAATDPQSGDLARDSGALALKRSLSQLAGSIVMPNAGGGAPRTLADLGLSTQRDGTFAFDGARLAASLKADPNAVAAMFTNGIHGVYGTIDALYRKATTATDPGSLTGSVNRYSSQKTLAKTALAELVGKQEALRQQFVTRFAVTQTRVSASTSTLSFTQNQIAAWNKSTS